MKKIVVWTSVFVWMISCMNAFALPKIKRVKLSKAATRLSRVSKEAIQSGKLRYVRPKVGKIIAQTAPRVRTGEVVSRVTQGVRKATPEMEQRVQRAIAQSEQAEVQIPIFSEEMTEGVETSVESFMAEWEQKTAAWRDAGGKPLYDNQVELARDVAKFYGSEGGQPYRGILNEELILYRVPEGIIYHPAKNFFPRVLDPEVDFIMWNPAENKGQVIKANLLSLFKKVETKAQKWKAIAKETYDSQAELARDIAVFYQEIGEQGQRMVDPFGREFIRYDLPADGIVYHQPGHAQPTILTADEYCIIYNPAQNAGQVMEMNSDFMVWFNVVK